MISHVPMAHRTEKIPDQCVYNFVPSPIGQLAVVTSDRGLHAIFFPKDDDPHEIFSNLKTSDDHPVYTRTLEQLQEYFSGNRKTFDIPLVLNGTRFQHSAWNLLREIPYGQTLSYEEQAIRLGGKEKVRAVARANAMNRIPILIPCHRVIGKNGALTGYGGGLAIKAFLLDLESRCSVSKPA
ncbi:MAG: methylated-DNA--[protein]-cysteine S-methyltransferase [Methylococcaceae bacterium]|nr:methylated-DNA--[protein]-cysteine S-methyltransferase [Methylococcaceae bacterium]MCI0733968.1 methylated-DNA--[protein]-cysteine S-methyltransferase [Methylococcaceae bacterium]